MRLVRERAVGGLPLLRTDLEDVEDGRSGLLVAPGDATALGAALARLIGDPELRTTLRGGAGDAFRRRFTAERLVDAVGRLYAECVAGG
jgi:glycogen synthase